MFDLFSLHTGDKIQLSDHEVGYSYGIYTYYNDKNDKNDKNHIFVPDDSNRDTIRRSNLEDIIFYHPLSMDNELEFRMKCLKCKDECFHYVYNAHVYKNVNIIPIDKIQHGHISICDTRLRLIYEAVVLPPINVVYYASTDTYHIENGNHRYVYSLQKGYQTIPCIIR